MPTAANSCVWPSSREKAAGPPGTSSVKPKPVPPGGIVSLTMRMVPVVGTGGGVPIWPRMSKSGSLSSAGGWPWIST